MWWRYTCYTLMNYSDPEILNGKKTIQEASKHFGDGKMICIVGTLDCIPAREKVFIFDYTENPIGKVGDKFDFEMIDNRYSGIFEIYNIVYIERNVIVKSINKKGIKQERTILHLNKKNHK